MESTKVAFISFIAVGASRANRRAVQAGTRPFYEPQPGVAGSPGGDKRLDRGLIMVERRGHGRLKQSLSPSLRSYFFVCPAPMNFGKALSGARPRVPVVVTADCPVTCHLTAEQQWLTGGPGGGG